jgi:iron(III) transport system substrate-binding protein
MLRFLLLLLVAASMLGLTACQPETSETASVLTVYSGRSKALVDSLVRAFEAETGITVNVRYGTDAALLAAIQEEGTQTPADIFWANTTGALAEVSRLNLLVPLPDSITGKAAAYVPSGRHWVPVTTRFRVLAYNTSRVQPSQLPPTVAGLTGLTAFKGRIGWTPAYSSFQDFVTALRVLHGEDSTRAWLKAMQALEPVIYPSNTPMIQALANGEIDLALTNHYYVLRYTQGGAEGEFEGREDAATEALEELGPQPTAPVALYHFRPGDAGNLALVTGAGLITHSRKQATALRFLAFLLSPAAQTHAATEVYEYPVVRGITAPAFMTPADTAFGLSPARFDFEQLRQLDGTLNLMREIGLL